MSFSSHHPPSTLLFCLISVLSFSQVASAQRISSAKEIKIIWQPETVAKINDNESVKFLNFEGAYYDGSLNSLPYYIKRIPHPFPGMEVQVTLKNAQYEPFTTNATIDLTLIGTEPKLTASPVTEKKQAQLGISLLPIRKNPGTQALERLVSFEFEFTPGSPQSSTASQRVYATSSVLASGNWYKAAVNKSGIYVINADMLRELGMNPSSVDPSKIRVFGNGGGMLPFLNSTFRHDDLEENAILVSDGGSTGVFDGSDYVLFYGEGPTEWYLDPGDQHFHHTLNILSDNTYYFITPELNNGTSPKRIQYQSSTSLPATHSTSTFDDYAYHDVELLNFIKSGRQWYGEQFDAVLSQTFHFSFPNINLTDSVYVKSNVIAHSVNIPTSFNVNYGSQVLMQQPIPSVSSSYTDDYGKENTKSVMFPVSGTDIGITLTYYPSISSTAIGYLNYLELNARRNLVMNGSQMIFRDKKTVGPGYVTTFNFSAASNVMVWEVTDPTNVKLQQYNSGTNFQLATDSLREFIAFDGSSYLSPSPVGAVSNQSLHSIGDRDLIILCHPNFLSEANRLADFHTTHSNLKTIVVTPEQVYNEFSGGAPDLVGIRDFLKMFYDRANNPSEFPDYFLLFGDGSYDNKGTSTSNSNFLPTYQSVNSLSLTGSYVSDDFYGFLDDAEGDWDDNTQDLLDVGVGRFPVKSLEEATIVVNKIIDYSTPGTFVDETLCAAGNSTSLGDWRNVVCFVADDQDSNLHLNDAEDLATYLRANHPVYNQDKIYIDAYPQISTPGGQRYPTVNEAIDRRMEKGALVMNYTGHGGETGWTGERILDNDMIQSWTNIRKLPLFITATCEFSRFDDPGRTSAGELVLIHSEAGGIALMTTTRLVWAFQNAQLNDAMMKALFATVNGQHPRLGDIYKAVKNDANVMNGNARNFTLLGDPALMVGYAKYDVVTTGVNGHALVTGLDTLSALSKVTITGEIRSGGQKLTNFNGIIYATVYDKVDTVSTLSNDSDSPVRKFALQKNALYKGKSSVNAGDFSFTFIVPKDIAYQIGNGRLSYYAHNGTDDAHGYYDSLLIGGSSANALADNIGPSIRLYLNDEKFVYGGTTDENPKIYALLTDTNGINTVGNGIGHDLTAVIDDNTDEVYVLNDYYEADLDSYQSGRVMYPLSDLSPGRHKLQLKVWDIYNNSAEAFTEFVVAESAKLALNHVLNYPNPFTTKTSFFFEHNRPCNTLDVQVQVYTVSGKLIKTINRSVTCEGYRVDDLDWDGRDDFGDPIGRGVYVYRLKIRDSDGATAEKYEKLVVLK